MGYLLGVVSDSHGSLAAISRVAPLLAGVDAVAHLGDGAAEAPALQKLTGLPVYSVAGNRDGGGAPNELVETLGGARVFLSHGHRSHVKATLLFLALRAQELEARVALYGHTHVPAVNWREGVLLVNPGALRDGRYATVEFGENGPVPRLLQM
ncbi:MAG: metallophosphoesterase [Clostridiales bacterium]|nr:metallophosphoesterase [Clostridiales bacterium]